MTKADTLLRLGDAGVIAVVRSPDAAGALRAVDALRQGGIRAVEITYTTPGATDIVAALAEAADPDTVLGAGTVTSPEQATEAAAAGAQYIVTPGTSPSLAAAVIETGAAAILGALTPSEVMAVLALGADAVKIFPASLGGPAYLKALRGPFPDLVLVPTGGVAVGNVGEWFAAGAHCLGAGGTLCSAALIADEQWDEITRRAVAFTEAVERSRT